MEHGLDSTAYERILADLASRGLAQPVPPEIRNQLAEPLINAVQLTLTEMTGAAVAARAMYRLQAPAAFGDVSATLTLSPPLDGALILSLSQPAAEAIARRVLDLDAASLAPAMVQDCTGEVANIVAGQAKALLAGSPYHFAFSTPTITLGQAIPNLRENMESLVVAFDSELGGFALQFCTAR